MIKKDGIVNGNFNAGNAGWNGTDLETNYNENAYLSNGSGNRVAEIDGHRNQRTVMQQTVKVTSSHTTDLTFRTALRNASAGNAGTEGFRVDIVDSAGKVIATQTYFPRSSTWSTQSLRVTFPGAGNYTVRFTELGPDDSLGAIIDDVSMLICFVSGTLIETATGAKPVEMLQMDDLVWTLDSGLQPVRWIGQRHLSLDDLVANTNLRPVVFSAGSLGGGLPLRALSVSPQHRVCVKNWQSDLYFGQGEVLVAAQSLVNGKDIRVANPEAGISYVHFLLDGHQIVRSEGQLTESFFPTPLSLRGLSRDALDEVLRLFPDLDSLRAAYPGTARPVLCGREAALVMQDKDRQFDLV